MTKREAKIWACDMAAALIYTDLESGEVIDDFSEDPDEIRKKEAMCDLIRELERRGRTTVSAGRADGKQGRA